LTRRVAFRPALRALVGALPLLWAACAAPIVPQRSRPGGSARWAETLALPKAVIWAPDAVLCSIQGAGVGSDGWLPDHGGVWRLYYWSANQPSMFEVSVDSEGSVHTLDVKNLSQRGSRLPSGWIDSPKVWSVTHSHQKSEAVHTLDAELALNAEPEKYATRTVWRIRFWMPNNATESHVVTPEAVWLSSY
jgi:hypothetical protein